MRGRRVLVAVRCPAGQSRCAGSLTVKAGRVKLGRVAFRLSDGQRKTLRVKLSRQRLRKIRLLRRVRVTATTIDARGNRATKGWTRALRLYPACLK